MKRRNFIRFAFAGASVGVVAPQSVFAGLDLEGKPSMAGGVYFTKQSPGRWQKKVASHLPAIEVSKDTNGAIIHVVTSHPMDGYEHYIVKHTVLDYDYNFIAEKMFDPMVDKAPVSDFLLGDYTGQFYVLSVCNKHDTWLNSSEV